MVGPSQKVHTKTYDGTAKKGLTKGHRHCKAQTGLKPILVASKNLIRANLKQTDTYFQICNTAFNISPSGAAIFDKPAPYQTLKLNNIDPGQYLDRRLLGSD